jgi:hypothetical protein
LGYDVPYLLEWVHFHHLAGVERFFLYNNGDRQAQRKLLEPYVDEGLVVLHDWPECPPVFPAYEHCLTAHRTDSRWIAFIDTDEFLFSPTGAPVSELLSDYERWPAVGVNWAVFGTSGHRVKPPGLVIESYRRRTNDARFNSHVKSVVDPTRVETYCDNPHFFFYEGSAVNENHEPFEGAFTKDVSFSRLRVNHYWLKSEEEATKKFTRPRADNGLLRDPPDFAGMDRVLNEQFDDAITTYVPRLRERLAAASDRTSAAGAAVAAGMEGTLTVTR